MHDSRRSGQASRLGGLLACLLIAIRLVAGVISETCFFDLQIPTTRIVHIHSVGDHGHCHHGRFSVAPLVAWACSACKETDGYALPEIPRLPIPVSFFAPLFLLIVSFGTRPLIVAHGRGPPLLVS